MYKNVNRLEAVRPLDGMVLEAVYSSGQTVRVDMSEIAARLKVFAPIADRTVFEQAAVTDWGHSVALSDDASIDADRLMEMSLEQSGRGNTLTHKNHSYSMSRPRA